MDLYIARQPVFDRTEHVFAYDLTALAPSRDGIHESPSSEELIAELFLAIGIDRVVPEQPVFIPLDRDLLFSRRLPALPQSRVIFDIPSSLNRDALTPGACAALRNAGYQVAVTANARIPQQELEELSRLANVVKVDVAGASGDELSIVADAIQKSPAQLLAVNVRHRGERDRCESLGFHLFEGFRFAAPEVYPTRVVPIQHLHAFQLLQLVRDTSVSDEEIELFLRRDVGLAYRLLRMVNSAAVGGRELTSIGHALRLLGRESLSRWLCMLLATQVAESGVKMELVRMALIRARMCERIGDVTGASSARGPLFLVGMLSVFDQLLEIRVDALCTSVGLAKDLSAALTARDGYLGSVLRLVESYVDGSWMTADEATRALAINPSILPGFYIEALEWASGSGTTVPQSHKTIKFPT